MTAVYCGINLFDRGLGIRGISSYKFSLKGECIKNGRDKDIFRSRY
jgi:hypothetical protein